MKAIYIKWVLALALAVAVPTRAYLNAGHLSHCRVSSLGSPCRAAKGVVYPQNNDDRTMYDILEATGNETRDELKRHYVKLAKMHHPDAAKGASGKDFSEIAAAWRVLSDPKLRKRYDRDLKAQQFSHDIMAWANVVGQQAAPVFEKVAIPFLRRTTATTWATIQAAADDLAKHSATESKDRDLSHTLRAAVNAAKRAGEYVDSIEWVEQAEDLQQRARQELKEAEQLEAEWREISALRLQMALRTPNSGWSATDALHVFNGWNITGSVWDLFNSINTEIHLLEMAEAVLETTQAEDAQVQADYEKHRKQHASVRKEMDRALLVAEEARKAYEVAKSKVKATQEVLDNAAHELQQAESFSKKSSLELEKSSKALTKQSEKVRKALYSKQREKPEEDGTSHEERLEKVLELKKKEDSLTKARAVLESKAARLQSRASQLLTRADDLTKKK